MKFAVSDQFLIVRPALPSALFIATKNVQEDIMVNVKCIKLVYTTAV